MELLWNQREPKTELSGPTGCCGLSFPTITRRNWRWLPKVALHIFKFTYCCRNASTKLTIPRTQKLVIKLVMATQDRNSLSQETGDVSRNAAQKKALG